MFLKDMRENNQYQLAYNMSGKFELPTSKEKICQLAIRDGLLASNDCNPGTENSIQGSKIEKFVIPGSHFGIRLTEWWLLWYQ